MNSRRVAKTVDENETIAGREYLPSRAVLVNLLLRRAGLPGANNFVPKGLFLELVLPSFELRLSRAR